MRREGEKFSLPLASHRDGKFRHEGERERKSFSSSPLASSRDGNSVAREREKERKRERKRERKKERKKEREREIKRNFIL